MNLLNDKIEVEKLLHNPAEGPQILPEATQQRILLFYELMRKENEIQNLTRLTSPSEFMDYHLADVMELLETGWLTYPALDLGSGAGIPGVLAALIDNQAWILTESEKKKAQYLLSTVDSLGLQQRVQVVPDRAEIYLRRNQVGTIVSRAVGNVGKIYGWIRKCSTWNKLILFKGPGWDIEWISFQESPFKDELQKVEEVNYIVGSEKKVRKLLWLERRIRKI